MGLVVFCMAILGKVLYIQLAEGEALKKLSDSKRVRLVEIEAERGSIYSEDNFVLSTSIPEFDIYIDYMADGLREDKGALFFQNLDSLAVGLSKLFGDKTPVAYKTLLKKGYSEGDRYALLKRKISFVENEALKELPLVRLGRNKSGFITEVRMKRLYPFKKMANRTIGIARESNQVGLERAYDQYLAGVTGRRLVRFISGGFPIPIDDEKNISSKDGMDIITTLEVGIQDIAHEALERMMIENEALSGTCIVMEVKTGKIRAIANLGRQPDGSYWEDYNYALAASEPGSTWKLTTLMAALEDKKITIQSKVNLEGGVWPVAGETVKDSEPHGLHEATIQQAFERSSNVGMAKITYYYYNAEKDRYFKHLSRWGMDRITGIDLPGEVKPTIYKPGDEMWSKTTLPWMGFGYSLMVTPLHTAMLYNAVANGGKMMKPYLVKAIAKEGEVIQEFSGEVLDSSICSPETIAQLKVCLEGVVTQGTAHGLKTDAYSFAGKTGTSLIADKGIKYKDKMYQSSFAGYFPAQNPEYTIVVVIKNKKHAPKFYGGAVAGPVFREVADRLYAGYLKKPRTLLINRQDSLVKSYAGAANTVGQVMQGLGLPFIGDVKPGTLGMVKETRNNFEWMPMESPNGLMPELKGIGLKDAIEICDRYRIAVAVKGRGKVTDQSVLPGTPLDRIRKIELTLN